MAEINYFQIEEAIGDILLKDPRTKIIGNDKLKVEVEENFQLIPDKTPWVGIYLDDWDSPAEEEIIGGTKPIRTNLGITLWLYSYALKNRTGAQLRDRLLQKVKEVLKKNRTLNNNVLTFRFAGGDFDNASVDEGFFKGVSLKLECEVRE